MCAMFGMVERGQDLSFTTEPGEPLRIACERVRQDLDRDLALQVRVDGRDTPRPCRPRRAGR
jgi:hypothetical protein